MKATEHEMTVATDAAARAAFAEANRGQDSGVTFEDLTPDHRRRLRQHVMALAVAAVESIPDRRHVAWLEGYVVADNGGDEEANPYPAAAS